MKTTTLFFCLKDRNTAVSHAWNAASHANLPYPEGERRNPFVHLGIQAIFFSFISLTDRNTAVSHVWNAAAHATDQYRPASPAVPHVWDHLQQYMHPSSAGKIQGRASLFNSLSSLSTRLDGIRLSPGILFGFLRSTSILLIINWSINRMGKDTFRFFF